MTRLLFGKIAPRSFNSLGGTLCLNGDECRGPWKLRSESVSVVSIIGSSYDATSLFSWELVTADSFAGFRRESVSSKLFPSSVPDVCSVVSLFWGIEVLVSAELKVSSMFPEAIEK